jgi:(1->4)-alpha-D-glucan 1-alpha-D-glucosylmutase
VDYDARRKILDGLAGADPADLLINWRDGRIKLYLTSRLLGYRREHFDLFAKGEYQPVQTSGAFAQSLFAYAREQESQTILVIAPRLSGRVGFPPLGALWRDTALDFIPAQPLRDIFTGRDFSPRLAESLAVLPFAAFVSTS